MKIRYSLTRAEVVRSFLQGLAKSPKLVARVLVYCLIAAILPMVISGAFIGGPTLVTSGSSILWTVGTFCLFLILLFATAKTAQRTMDVSEDGISTSIGKLRGLVDWGRIADVRDTGPHVLIVGRSGNSFFIPNRAFNSPDQKTQFISEICEWRGRAGARD